MRNFYFILLILFAQVAWGQTSTPGVTVIVHGFDAGGDYKLTSGFSTWRDHAISLREYIKQVKNKAALIFVNDTKTGFWKVLDLKNGWVIDAQGRLNWGAKYYYREDVTQVEIDNSEKIFLYNWANLSNDGALFDNEGVDALEAAADNLFALLVDPVIAVKPIPIKIARNKVLFSGNDDNVHFIAHSRGNIVSLQVFNRIKKHFPSIKIGQWTALDPHPASKMGDIKSGLNTVSKSLPYVFGTASGCNPTGIIREPYILLPSLTPNYLAILGSLTTNYLDIKGLCGTNSNIFLEVPENVKRADNYFRKSQYYEPLNATGSIGEFSGVSIPRAGTYNREMDNSIMTSNSGVLGGAHSAVHNWYWGTFESVSAFPNSFVNTLNQSIPIPKVDLSNHTNWYTNSIGSWFNGANKNTTGYFHSRLGGGVLPTEIAYSYTVDNTNNRAISIPHNGSLDNNNFSGYKLNGGNISWTNAVDGKFFLHGLNLGKIKTSYFYLPPTAGKLIIKARAVSGKSNLKISIRDSFSGKSFSKSVSVLAQPSGTYLPIELDINSSYILDKTVQLEFSSGEYAIEIDELKFTTSSGANLRINNTILTLASSYFDFPVDYDVNPAPLIKGTKPTSFKATITNTMSQLWVGSLKMYWRKASESGKGILLKTKSVSLSPGMNAVLDRGTDLIISESDDYILGIYANNDEIPIDEYFFYVDEPEDVSSQSISVSPVSSNFGFGNVEVNTSKTQTFTITNTSNTNVSISNYVLSGTGFVQGTTNCCGTLAPNQSYILNVIFQPNAPNAFSGNLQINGTFTDAPINITISGTGTYATPPANGCIESSVSSVNIQSGNTDALKQQFFNITNTSQTGAVGVTGVSFTGVDASYFSYDANLFSVPTSLTPSLSTGFLVKFSNPQNTTRTYNANLVLTTNNPSCSTVTIPVSATHMPSQLSWLEPVADYTIETLGGGVPNSIKLSWQGYIPATNGNVPPVDIQYTIDGGITWTSRNNTPANYCTTGHNNADPTQNVIYFQIDQFGGKDIQFRIKPCYENITPWQYSGICHIIQQRQATVRVISPNGYEVLAGGSTVDIKWSNFIGYKAVSLLYTTNNGISWQTIATNISGQATYYRWQVPTGVKSSECRIKITAANIFDESDDNFVIQPALTTPITYANLVILPEGCGTTPNGGVSFQLLGGTPPYNLAWIEANVGAGTINASYVTTSTNGLRVGTNRCVVTDANYNKVLFTFEILQKAIFTYKTIVNNAICNGNNGIISLNVAGDYQYLNNATLSKNGSIVSTSFSPYFSGLSTGYYSVELKNYDGCTQVANVIVDTSPGTYFNITPTITNTSCSGATGAISLNVSTAQNPTYLWSNGATSPSLSGLSAGQYSVNITDATGCVQSQRLDVVEVGGFSETLLANNKPGSAFSAFVINQDKIYFDEYRNSGNPYNRLAILNVQTNNYDYIQIPSLYNSANTSLRPEGIEATTTDIYAIVQDFTNGNYQTHFVKINSSTKQITNRVISNQDYTNLCRKLIFVNNRLYVLRGDSKMDIVNFTNNTFTTHTFTEDVANVVFNATNNKLYIVGWSTKLYEFDVITNILSRTGILATRGQMIQKVGSTLYIVGSILGDNNTYVETFDISSFSSTGTTLIRNTRNLAWSRSFIKDNRYFYIPEINPKVIDVFDTQTKTITTIPVSVNTFDIDYSATYDKIFVNGTGGGVVRLDNNKFDFTTTKTDINCGTSTGSITLTIPNDGKIYTYLWSNGATTKDISGLLAGIYTVAVTQTGGCVVKKTISVVELSGAFVATVSPNTGGNICPSTSLALVSSAGQSYVWYKDNVVIPNTTSQTYGASIAGSYKVVVTNSNNCTATSNVVPVTVIPNTVSNFTFTVSGNVSTFTNTSANGNQYLWSFGDNTTDTQFSPIKTYATSGGTFSVKLKTTNSCNNFNEITKTVTTSCTQMYSIKSGNWLDASVWSCGRVPNTQDNILIKANHNVYLNVGQTGVCKFITTERNAVLNAPKGSILKVLPN